MKPDYLFVIVGVAALCLAVAMKIRNVRCFRRGEGVLCLLWVCFGVGLIIQGCAPNLRIERERFLISASSAKAPIDPIALVKRERQMQMLSALLTGGAAVGLALRYRALFLRPNSRQEKQSQVRTPAAS